MNTGQRSDFEDPIIYPQYVIRMGWSRMGKEAKIKWAKELRKACYATIKRIDDYLRIVDA